MHYAIFTAICSSLTPVQDCGRENSLDWIAVPSSEQPGGLSGCQVTAMEFAAQTGLVKPGVHPKIFCRPESVPTIEADALNPFSRPYDRRRAAASKPVISGEAAIGDDPESLGDANASAAK
jgi:hypothetical protein